MKVVFLLLLGVWGVCGLHVGSGHMSRFGRVSKRQRTVSRIEMVSTDNSASTSENSVNDDMAISMPKVHISASNTNSEEENRQHMAGDGTGKNSKVKNLKKAPGQDLPEVLKSWNELQGLSEREMLANDDPSFKRNKDALGLAYRR